MTLRNRGQRDREHPRETRAKLPREIRHRLEIRHPTRVDPAIDLPPAKRRLSECDELRFDLLATQPK